MQVQEETPTHTQDAANGSVPAPEDQQTGGASVVVHIAAAIVQRTCVPSFLSPINGADCHAAPVLHPSLPILACSFVRVLLCFRCSFCCCRCYAWGGCCCARYRHYRIRILARRFRVCTQQRAALLRHSSPFVAASRLLATGSLASPRGHRYSGRALAVPLLFLALVAGTAVVCAPCPHNQLHVRSMRAAHAHAITDTHKHVHTQARKRTQAHTRAHTHATNTHNHHTTTP